MDRRNRHSAFYPPVERRESPAEVSLPAFGIYMVESYHSAKFKMPMGHWPFHKLCWVPMGKGALGLNGATVPVYRDDVFLIPASVEHQFIDNPTEPMTLIMACFSPEISTESTALAEVFARVRESFAPCRPMNVANAFQMEEIRIAFRHLLNEQSRCALGFQPALHAGLIALLVRLLRGCDAEVHGRGVREHALDGVLDYLDSNFDQPIQLNAMAARCDLSPRRFSDVFKQRTGRSLIDYLNLKRIEHAKIRLRQTGHIAYACHESGFQDMAYFYRVFRKHTGQTPGEYVKTFQS